jgi:hypothetical protein
MAGLWPVAGYPHRPMISIGQWIGQVSTRRLPSDHENGVERRHCADIGLAVPEGGPYLPGVAASGQLAPMSTVLVDNHANALRQGGTGCDRLGEQ